ncbi:MAG: DNA-processing protein DprA [Syntrophomonadaceae bacterium]|nr:DNA-processing protein DprA [Syntrophomonadaceae bacterium]
MIDKTELACIYFFHTIPGVGNRTLWKIKEEFGTFQRCWEAKKSAWHGSSLPEPIQAAMAEARSQTDPLTLLDKLRADEIKICCVEDDDYPELLRSIYDPPYIFYYRGALEILNKFCLGIVGARAATTYGKVQARRFGNELAGQGITVVSGMARGIDTEAHQGALAAEGKTVAVLGSGLKVVYPPENQELFNRLCENGLVISEFSPLTRPEPGNFPTRNRTISGLCRGVLVVEAKQKSGALITADFALEQGREVFAVPGPITSKNSDGTNYLIKQGACLVRGIADIFDEFGLNQSSPAVQGELLFDLEPEESAFLENMDYEAVHFDALLQSTALDIGQLSAMLLKMELKGIIRAMPGNYYVKL